MTLREKKQVTLLAFLTDNMREMETELRAHSIVFEALGKGVIEVGDMEAALTSARGSTAMLAFVQTKYAMVAELCSTEPEPAVGKDLADWPQLEVLSKLPN